mgnify:CR=1 FL=1
MGVGASEASMLSLWAARILYGHMRARPRAVDKMPDGHSYRELHGRLRHARFGFFSGYQFNTELTDMSSVI